MAPRSGARFDDPDCINDIARKAVESSPNFDPDTMEFYGAYADFDDDAIHVLVNSKIYTPYPIAFDELACTIHDERIDTYFTLGDTVAFLECDGTCPE